MVWYLVSYEYKGETVHGFGNAQVTMNEPPTSKDLENVKGSIELQIIMKIGDTVNVCILFFVRIVP